MTNGVRAWSYSAFNLYDQCPYKYKLCKIDKLPEPRSEALIRGDETHKKVAAYLAGVTDVLPNEARHFASQMQQLKTLDPIVEQQWAFTNTWRETGYFAEDTWYRATLDAAVIYPDKTADVVDHKTGKLYATNEDQIRLFAATLMIRYPQVTHVTARLWYLDSGDEIIREYSAADRDPIRNDWLKKIGPLFADTTWAPKPGPLCRFCHFRKDNGGPCRF